MLSLDPNTLLGIAVVALITALNRMAGFYLMRHVPITPRVRRILDALPGSVLVALLAPGAVRGDLGMMVGLVVAFLAAKLVRNDLVPVAAAMAAAAGLRALMG